MTSTISVHTVHPHSGLKVLFLLLTQPLHLFLRSLRSLRNMCSRTLTNLCSEKAWHSPTPMRQGQNGCIAYKISNKVGFPGCGKLGYVMWPPHQNSESNTLQATCAHKQRSQNYSERCIFLATSCLVCGQFYIRNYQNGFRLVGCLKEENGVWGGKYVMLV